MYNLKAGHSPVLFLRSMEFNIDAGSGTTVDDVIDVPYDIKILKAQIVYTEATDTSGVASANVKLGTAAGGAQIVAATALEVSKSVGDATALTLVSDPFELPANDEIFIRLTGIAATEAGKFRVQIWASPIGF